MSFWGCGQAESGQMMSVARADTFYCCSDTNKTSPSRLPREDGAARRLAWKLQEKPQETQRETTGPRGHQPPGDKALPSLGATYLATAPSRGQALGQGCPNPATGPVSHRVRGWAGAKIPQPPAPGELREEARGAEGLAGGVRASRGAVGVVGRPRGSPAGDTPKSPVFKED